METILAGDNVIRQMRDAKEQGFEIIVFYAGLADVRLNIECIALRVKNGGYHIETEDIVRRNLTSMNNLISHSELIDQIKCYLNGLPGCTQEINRKLQIKFNMQKETNSNQNRS